MTSAVRSACHLALLATVGPLAGCGNSFEHITLGEWREVGHAQPPPVEAGQTPFIVVTTAALPRRSIAAPGH